MGWSVVVVGAAAFVAFGNTMFSHFTWDDRGAILMNLDVRTDVTPLRDLFAHDFWGMNLSSPQSHKSYRPLTVATFRLNYAVHGLHPHGYHITNVLLHVVVSILVVSTGRVLCSPSSSSTPVLAGLLFAVHPIHCDSVASVVGRADILCTAISLLALLAYNQRLRHVQHSRRLVWTMVAIGCTCLATMAKETGFTMFAVLLAMEWSSDTRYSKAQSGALMVAGVMFLAWRVQMNGSSTTLYTWSIYENEFAHLPSFVSKAMSYAHVHTLYLWKLLWPQYLCYDYGWNTIHAVTSIYDVRNLASSVAYMAVVGAVGTSASHRRTSPLFVLLVLGICPFVPASHVMFPVGTILAERLLYLPSVGFCLVVGYATERVLLAATPASKPKLVALLGLVLAVATSRTIRRNLDWHDEHTLFQSALSVAPTSVKVLTNLGQDILPKDARTAVLYLERAVALMPSYSLGHLNLAAGYAALKKPLQAMHHLVQSIELVQEPKAYTSLGQHFVEFWESHVGAGQSTLHTAAHLVQTALDVGATYPSASYGQAKVAFALGNMGATLQSLAITRTANAYVASRGYDLNEVVDPCFVDTLAGLAWEHMNTTTALAFYISFFDYDDFSDISQINWHIQSWHFSLTFSSFTTVP
ncbi:hypothetical protein, variant [Aphanomyces astaci]|uniref:DUF1736 domain-containing protein n=1 Tax=Aphanomyces astaci TaxID=112090 RepID=W4GTI1_APHAT|nr:hypothetical protein, variant [Aphanomyces astaci]ETV83022.1 hypothetical protein, variant [Aphanomyces astaci]|eukprot:XP_009827693.1 hypothetical protein, variant [Aphanomyces astaci]